MNPHPKLLVLDLDETLVHATETPLAGDADFRAGPYHVYLRPHVQSFVNAVFADFKVGIWTASGDAYATQIVERVFTGRPLEFVWSSRRCTVARDWTTGKYQTLKNLRKLKRKGYPLEAIIAVDDTPAKHARSYGNLVAVREFLGDPADTELPLLAAYLKQLAAVPNVRTVEKRRWREQVLAARTTSGG
jgi:carboxy-terminal domain RNA polymerase II polypeptide A small phosphatase